MWETSQNSKYVSTLTDLSNQTEDVQPFLLPPQSHLLKSVRGNQLVKVSGLFVSRCE